MAAAALRPAPRAQPRPLTHPVAVAVHVATPAPHASDSRSLVQHSLPAHEPTPVSAALCVATPAPHASDSTAPVVQLSSPTRELDPVSAVLIATPAPHASASTVPVQHSFPTHELTMTATESSAFTAENNAAPVQHEAQVNEQRMLETAQALAASDGSMASALHDSQMRSETERGARCAETAPAELPDDQNAPNEAFLGLAAAPVPVGSPLPAAPSCTARQTGEPATPTAAVAAAQAATTTDEGVLNFCQGH